MPTWLTEETIRNGLFAALGFLLKIVWDTFRQKTKTLPYSVSHASVGITTTDVIFGAVQVTWQGNVQDNLFFSKALLENPTLTDFSHLTLTVSGGIGTTLLSEGTRVHGTTRSIPYSANYAQALNLQQGQAPSAHQLSLYRSRREYELPVFNRGERVEFSYLTTISADKSMPALFVDVSQAGLRTKLMPPAPEIFGVPARAAGLIGILVCLAALIAITGLTNVSALETGLALAAGLVANLIGVAVIKLYKWTRRLFH